MRMASHLIEKAEKSGASVEQIKYLKQMEENKKVEEDQQFQEALDEFYDTVGSCGCGDPNCGRLYGG
jgi:hypothetical protein